MLERSMVNPITKEVVENSFWKVNEICLNFINKDISYINVLGYVSETQFQEWNYFPSDDSYVNVKVDPLQFDSYFSAEALEESSLFEKVEEYLKSTGMFI